jgi:hypothetical protein
MAIAAFPVVPAYSGPGLDGSWVMGLGMAHAQGLVHGKDIIWTYGPLAYLSLPDGTMAPLNWTLVYHLGLYLLWALALVRLALSPRNLAPAWSVLLIGMVAIVEPSATGDHLELACFTIAALALVESGYWRIAELVLLAFLSSLAILVKLSLGIQVAVLLVCVLASLFPGWRSKAHLFAVAACLPVFSFALYWLVTGSPTSYLAYVRYAMSIASGYSDSMGAAGPLSQVAVALTSLVLLFLAMPLLTKDLRELALGFAPALASAFFFFKEAMVRQDAHAAPFQVMLALTSLFFLVTVPTLRYRLVLRGFQVASIAVGYIYISQAWPQTGLFIRQRLTFQINGTLSEFLHGPETWSFRKRQSEEALSELRLGPRFAQAIGKGSVEAVPWDVAQVRANHWIWQPRPIFQSYAAYTPALDRLNADHSREYGADFLLAAWAPIDGRHPFFEDPLSWQTLLDRYRSDISDGTTLLMRRAPNSRFSGREEVGSSLAHWNEVIAVPQRYSPLLLSADVRKNLLGTAAGLIFRLTPVWIEVTRQSGQTERYRTVPDNLGGGVVVNPLPQSLMELNLFGRPDCVSANPVISLQFIPGNRREFRDEIPLHWIHLRERNATTEDSTSCVVVEASRTEFPSWGGAGRLMIAAGARQPSKAESSVDWLSVTPPLKGAAPVDFALRANPLPESRRGSVSIGSLMIEIIQAGIPGDAVPRSVGLGLFSPGSSARQAPADTSNYRAVVESVTTFGQHGDQPVMGDWTGSGVVRIGVFRNGLWYLDLNNNRRWDGVEGGDGVYAFGSRGDKAVVGDWTGDGITKLGIFRQGIWVLDINNNRQFDHADPFFRFGSPGDLPAVGKWKPSSSVDQIGVFRKGTWIVDSNGDRAYQPTDAQYHFGSDGDLPVVTRSHSRIGVYRHGTWILDMEGSRRFEPTAAFIPYGSLTDRPLIGEW